MDPTPELDLETQEAPLSDAPKRQRLSTFEVTVIERVIETPDTVTLVYAADRPLAAYQAGQFLTIDPHQFAGLSGYVRYFEEQKGKKEPARAYSMASTPAEPLAITIKEEPFVAGATRYPPLLSPYLVRSCLPGMRMTVTGFTGHYTLPKAMAAGSEQIVHLCAGSGIVPSYGIIKDVLARHPHLKQTLIFGNKTAEDAIFGKHLDALADRHPSRFTYLQALSREADAAKFGAHVMRGRVSRELIAEAVPDLGRARFFVCGPGITPFERKAAKEKGVPATPRFIETVLGYLKELGVDRKQITQEAFG